MGEVKKQGIQNSIITYGGIIIGFVSLLIVQPRFLTKEEIGLTRVLFSFSALLATFMPFGMNSITLKFFPQFRNRDKSHYGFFGFMLLLPLAGFLLFGGILFLMKSYIIAHYVGQSKLFTDYFYYVFPLTFFLSYISVLNAYSFSLFKTSFPALLNDVVVRILSIVLFSIYFIKAITLSQFVMFYVVIYGIQLVVLVFYIFIIDNPSFKIDAIFIKEKNPKLMFKYGLLLSFAALSSLGLKCIDIVMLGLFKPTVAGFNALDVIGVYAISVFIPTVIEAPLLALEKIGLAKIADGWARQNMFEIKEIYFKSARYLFLIGGLLFLGINLNIDSLYRIIPGEGFDLGKNVVLIVSLGTLANMATGINDSIIFTSDKYIYGTYMLIVLFVLAVTNNYILIPRLGMEGAALATALSALVFNALKFIFIWKSFKLQPLDRKSLYILLLIIVTWLLFSFFPHLNNPVMDIGLRSVMIGVFFASGVVIFKIVPEFNQLVLRLIKK